MIKKKVLSGFSYRQTKDDIEKVEEFSIEGVTAETLESELKNIATAHKI